jgi:hypothetical protein
VILASSAQVAPQGLNFVCLQRLHATVTAFQPIADDSKLFEINVAFLKQADLRGSQTMPVGNHENSTVAFVLDYGKEPLGFIEGKELNLLLRLRPGHRQDIITVLSRLPSSRARIPSRILRLAPRRNLL